MEIRLLSTKTYVPCYCDKCMSYWYFWLPVDGSVDSNRPQVCPNCGDGGIHVGIFKGVKNE